MTYAVASWQRLYESRRSTSVEKLSWVGVPNTFDEEGWALLMRQPDSMTLWGCWTVLLMIASRCPLRGVLVKGTGVPYDAESVAARVMAQPAVFERALEFFHGIEWLVRGTSRIGPDGGVVFNPHDSHGFKQRSHGSEHHSTWRRRKTRTDSNSIRTDSNMNETDSTRLADFSPAYRQEEQTDAKSVPGAAGAPGGSRRPPKCASAPDPEEVVAFAIANRLSIEATRDFVDHFKARGWRNQFGHPIKFWRGRLRSWVNAWEVRRRKEERRQLRQLGPAATGTHSKPPPAVSTLPESCAAPSGQPESTNEGTPSPNQILKLTAEMRAAVNRTKPNP